MMPLRAWYPVTVTLGMLGFYALEQSSLIAAALFVGATYAGFAGAIKHQAR